MSTMRNSGISIMLAPSGCVPSGSQSAAQTSTLRDPGTTFTSLFSFDNTNGEFPEAALVQATDGNLYGTTAEGGANCPPLGCGTVFKISPSGALTMLHTFDGTDGSEPHALGLAAPRLLIGRIKIRTVRNQPRADSRARDTGPC